MIKIKRTKDGKEWYATIVATNGQVLFTSETYKRIAGAHTAIAALGRMYKNGQKPEVEIEE